MTSSSEKRNTNKDESSHGSKRDEIPPEYLGSVLRAEIMPASEVSPDQAGVRDLLRRVNIRYVVLGIVLLIITGMSLVFAFGPGKPALENALQNLKNRYVQATSTNTPTVVSKIVETPRVVPSSTSTPTERSTSIPASDTPTNTPALTPTLEDLCINAIDVTDADVGSTLCVRGTITGLEEREVGFIIYFSDERGVFYLVAYDLVWNDAEPGDCIQITGEVQQLGSTPVIVFGWSNLPEFCPE